MKQHRDDHTHTKQPKTCDKTRSIGWLCLLVWLLPWITIASAQSERCQRLVQQKQYAQAATCLRGLTQKGAIEHCTEGIVLRKLASQQTSIAKKRSYYHTSLRSFALCSKGGPAWKEATTRHTQEIQRALRRLSQPQPRTPKRLAPTRPRLQPKRPVQRPRVRPRVAIKPKARPTPIAKKRKAWPWLVGIGIAVGVGTAVGVTIYFATRSSDSIELSVPFGSR